jgi:uncharacterized protein YhfF/isopentenyldiphosphate isomerase
MSYDDDRDGLTGLPTFELGFPGPLRDHLVSAVLSGAKTSTTSLMADLEARGDPLPEVGDRQVLIDSDGRPVAVIQVTEVAVLPLTDVDLAHARAGGEGYESVEQWRAAHERFWRGSQMRAALGDPRFTVTDATRVVTERFRIVERIGVRSLDELLDIVDEHDRVIGQAPRGEATERGLRHRCAFVLVRDCTGRIFVHRRTARKLVFPSLYDMFVGGVVGAGESYDEAALREAQEELGVSALPRPVHRVKFHYQGTGRHAHHRWWSQVYEVRCDLPVAPQAEEIAWHAFLSEEELQRRLPEWPWVPDGLAAYEALRRANG